MSIFIEDTELIDIKVYYKKSGHNYKAYTDSELKDLKLKEETRKKYQCLNLKMKPMTWALFNDFQDKAMVESPSGERYFNFKVYKENKIKELVREWDAKKDDKPAQVDPNALSKLAPAIAETILRAYDEVSLLDEDEEKN